MERVKLEACSPLIRAPVPKCQGSLVLAVVANQLSELYRLLASGFLKVLWKYEETCLCRSCMSFQMWLTSDGWDKETDTSLDLVLYLIVLLDCWLFFLMLKTLLMRVICLLTARWLYPAQLLLIQRIMYHLTSVPSFVNARTLTFFFCSFPV